MLLRAGRLRDLVSAFKLRSFVGAPRRQFLRRGWLPQAVKALANKTSSFGKPGVLRAAPESVALGNGTNNVSTPSVAHGAPERPAERL